MSDAKPQELRHAATVTVAAWLSESWYFAIVAVAIFFSGPMIGGYAVVDEVAFYVVLSLVVSTIYATRMTYPIGLRRVHHWIYLAFATYLVAQSIRGMFVLGDIRVIRFVALFAGVGLVAWFLPTVSFGSAARVRLARTVLLAGAAYLTAYLIFGIVSETALGARRFDLQGHWWSGTATAVFPIFIMLPALAVISPRDEGFDRWLFWISATAIFLVGFYYQSRSAWLASLALIATGYPWLRLRRALILVIIYLGMILLFPWTNERLLTATEFTSSVADSMRKLGASSSIEKLERFSEALFGSLRAGAHTGRLLAKFTPEGLDQSTPGAMRGSEKIANGADIDRKIAILSTVRYLTGDGIGRFLFGGGYYAHRIELVPVFQETATKVGYHFPNTYLSIVRTATFNGMLADLGVMGFGLLTALFLLSALTIVTSDGGPKLTSLASLGLVALSFLVSLHYDMVLLYLSLMPGAVILGYHPRRVN